MKGRSVRTSRVVRTCAFALVLSCSVAGFGGVGTLTPVGASNGRTSIHAQRSVSAASVDSFVRRWTNRYADYDGRYGAQCVDLFNFYNRDVVHAGFAPVTYAYQLYNTYDHSRYTRLSASATPRKGDVAIWNQTSSNPGGHVAILLSKSGSTLRVFTQNPGPAHIGNLTTTNPGRLLGYLRPR